MSDLLTNLSSTSRALAAQQFGLETTGHNISNLNTKGYVRRAVDLAEVRPSAGGGVEVQGAPAQRSALLQLRVFQERPGEQLESAMADSLSVVETTLGKPGESLDANLTAFFDAFATLAQSPTSAVARDGVVLQGRLLARAFNDMSARLDDSQREADAQARDAVVQINALSARIATLNESIARASNADAEALKDRQTNDLETLAGLTDITVLTRPDGSVDVTTGSGRPLVIGENSYQLAIGSAGGSGLATISSDGVDITGELTGGRLGGLLRVRDTLLPGYKSQLDSLAYDVANQVNTLHRAGYDLNGGTGHNFFAPPAAVAGAAAGLAMDAPIVADARLISASASATAVGDNQVANAIASVRDGKIAVGGTSTPAQAWSLLVYQVGSDSATAKANLQSRQDIVGAVERLRDQVSGVSLDEEAASMLRFQRAYEANARYFTVIDRALDTLMGMIGVG